VRVKLKKDWRRYTKGQELTGGAARDAIAEKAGKGLKPTEPEEK